MYKISHLLSLGLLLVTVACSTVERTPVFTDKTPQLEDSITVMTYNIENLFDTIDDPNKNDETFLPIEMKKRTDISAKCKLAAKPWWVKSCLNKDWNESALKMKMKRLRHVLSTVNKGKGPDVLLLQEVENRQVLERWRRDYLAEFGYYPAFLIEGPDKRGIDTAILTRLKVKELKLHKLKIVANENLKPSEIRSTRGILEATLRLPDNNLLTVLSLHFPSQGAPTEVRRQAVLNLNSILKSMPKERMVIAGGDFNITSTEDAKGKYYTDLLAKNWGVSHLMNCDNCRGTNYYHFKRQWSFFDALLFSPTMMSNNSQWKVVPETIHISNKSRYQMSRWGTPSRFSQYRKDGVSDHWPMVAQIVPMKSAKNKSATSRAKVAK